MEVSGMIAAALDTRAANYGGITRRRFYCLNNHFIDMQILGEFDDARMNCTIQVTHRRGG